MSAASWQRQQYGVYVHIPFCAHKCPYCDFTTFAVAEPPQRAYVDAVRREYAIRDHRWSGGKVRSIFFGGGTPSFLDPSLLGEVIYDIASAVRLASEVEITAEANPEHLTHERLEQMLLAGINRLSVGAQSFNDEALRRLGRNHSAQSAIDAITRAREVGFYNISVDLMYATSGQTESQLRDDLRIATALPVQHISAYSLTIEEGTPYFMHHARGALPVPDQDQAATLTEVLVEVLAREGFARYEVSNFVREPEFKSQHNLGYWNHGEYLGLGAGAHSFLKWVNPQGKMVGERWSNVGNYQTYMQRVGSGSVQAWQEQVVDDGLLFETFFVGLRKVEGIDCRQVASELGVDPRQIYQPQFAELVAEGLVTIRGDMVAATPRGMLLLNSLLDRLIITP